MSNDPSDTNATTITRRDDADDSATSSWRPFPWLHGYDKSGISKDVLAAVTIWALLVPQALAYGQLSGLPAVYGLYAAIGGVALYGIYGTSKHLDVGPEATVATLVATTIVPMSGGDAKKLVTLSAILALLVGGVLIIGGLVKLGFVTRLLSIPVLIGYITGSAIVIISGQLDDLFGITFDSDRYSTSISALFNQFSERNNTDLAVGLGTIVTLLVLRKFAPKVPGYLLVVVVAIAATRIWHLDDEGLTVVGDIQGGLPTPSFGGVDVGDILQLVFPALAIGLLAYVDSISTVKAIAQKEGYEIDPNREFFGLAASNIGSGLLQGFAVNGSQSRSFAAADAGSKSQLTSLVVAVLVLFTVLFLTGPFELLPKATLAGIVIVVGIGLLDFGGFRNLWRVRRSDFSYAAATVFGVVVVGMLEGVGIAVVLSLFDVARRALVPHTAELVRIPGTNHFADARHVVGGERIPGLLIYKFDAPLTFVNVESATSEVDELIASHAEPIEALLISAGAVTDIDITAIEVINQHLVALHDQGIKVAYARVSNAFYTQVDRSGSMLEVCDAVYYEVDDGVAAFLEQRFAADHGVLDERGQLIDGVTFDRSEVIHDHRHPRDDVEATRRRQAELARLADQERDATTAASVDDGDTEGTAEAD